MKDEAKKGAINKDEGGGERELRDSSPECSVVQGSGKIGMVARMAEGW